MKTIQIALDADLLKATDRAAMLTKRNRSSLIRDALREHLRQLQIRTPESRDREGFANQPENYDEATIWEGEAAWPAE
jgi:metal-responsive CopG/Arc/MetJ family transcriptional regulator